MRFLHSLNITVSYTRSNESISKKGTEKPTDMTWYKWSYQDSFPSIDNGHDTASIRAFGNCGGVIEPVTRKENTKHRTNIHKIMKETRMFPFQMEQYTVEYRDW